MGIFRYRKTKNIKKQVRNEVMDDMKEWHKGIESDSHQEDHHLFFRHIHVNHGPVLEKSIEADKKSISTINDALDTMKLFAINTLPDSFPLSY